ARKDPSAAFAWAKESGDVKHLEEVIGQVSDPREVLSMLAILTPEQQATINKGFSALHRQPEAILALLEQQGGLTADASAYLAEYAKRALEPREPRSETPPKTTADLAKIIHANEHLKEDDLRQSDIGALRQAIAALPTEDAKRSLLILSNRARRSRLSPTSGRTGLIMTRKLPLLGLKRCHRGNSRSGRWSKVNRYRDLPLGTARNGYLTLNFCDNDRLRCSVS
ncbi:MAG: hypothetical protein ACKVHP_21930, partial [Verrucomicrobiales bacterium]